MKVLVCGSRDYTDSQRIYVVLEDLYARGFRELVHGDYRGADKIAARVGNYLGYKVFPEAAEWTKYGGAAGPKRNARMLENHPDIALVVWFHDNLNPKSGTQNMIDQATKKGIPIEQGSIGKVAA